MDEQSFWALIQRARGSSSRANTTALRSELEQLTTEQLEGFQSQFDRAHDRAYRWNLWGAAYLIRGGCSDDGFIDFRSGLISFGRDVYNSALRNPDNLADADLTSEIEDEGFAYVAQEVYEEKAGKEMPRSSLEGEDDMGEEWDFDDEDELERRFPRLSAKLDSIYEEKYGGMTEAEIEGAVFEELAEGLEESKPTGGDAG